MKIQLTQQSETTQDISQISEPLDIPISITPEPKPTVFQNEMLDGTIEDVTINVPQPAYATNLRVEQQRLVEYQANVIMAQVDLDSATAMVATQQALVDEMQLVSTSAVQATVAPELTPPVGV